MKKIILIFFCAVTLCLSANAQTAPKFGHINTSELIALMPERDSAIIKLQAYNNDLIETLQGMEDEYNAKVTEFQRKQNDWAPVVLEAKSKEIQELAQRAQQFQQSAQQDMQQMQQTLMAPVIDKAQKVLLKLSKDNGLIYLFDLSAGSILYQDETASINLLPLAKKELGIPAEKVAPTQIPESKQAK